jgi:hypothetical protein
MLSQKRNLQLAHRCNRIAKWLLISFFIAVPLFLTGAWIGAKHSEFYGTLLAVPAAVVVLLSGLAYPWPLMFRELFASGRDPLRFSLYQLLSIITGASIAMGMIIYLIQALSK